MRSPSVLRRANSTMRYLPVVLLLALAVVPGSAAPQKTGPIFYAPFDGGLDAAVGAAKAAAVIRDGKPVEGAALPFEKGVRGQAALFGDAWVRFQTAGNLNAPAGTVSLWVKPVTWAGRNDDFHTLFVTPDGPNRLILYKYFKGGGGLANRFCFYTRGEGRIGMLSCDAMAGWQKGEWHHVAATWAEGDMRLYADGALQARAEGHAPAALGDTFEVAPAWGESKERDTLVDEFRIYDRPLSPGEVKAEFAAGYRSLAAGAPPRPEAAAVQFLRFPAEETVLAYADLSRVPARAPERTAGTFEIASGAKVLLRQSFARLDDGACATERLSVKGLAPGTYTLRVKAVDGAGPAIEASIPYEHLAPPEWAGKRLGISDRVLPPYKPVALKGTVAQLTLADYDLTGALVLRQVTARTDANAGLHPAVKRFHRASRLLAGPVRLLATVNGKPLRVAEAPMRVVKASPHQVLFESRQAIPGATLVSQVTLDYDGVALVRLSLTPGGKPVTVSDIRLEIPLVSDQVRLMNTNSQSGNKMESTAGRVQTWAGPWTPLVWLGDEYRGLCYFADTSRGWTGDLNKPGRMQVARENGQAVFRMNLVAEPLNLARPWRTEFALCATPSRPMPAGWRGLVRDGVYREPNVYPEMDPVGVPVRFRVWWAGGGDITGRYDYPVPRYDDETLRKAWTSSKTVSDIVHHYPNSTWEEGPESKRFIGDWSSLSTADLIAHFGGERLAGGHVDWDTTAKEFWLHHIDRMMQWGLDGMYIDDPYIYPSYNDRLGRAWVDETGKLRPSYGMLGLRDYFRRLRTLAHQRSQAPWIDIHMSAQNMLPFYLYCDSFVNGEHLNLRLKEHYVGELRVEEILAQYTGYPWGLAPYLLPELGAEFRQKPEPTREFFSLLTAHDVWYWRGWCSKKEIDRPLKALQGEFWVGAPDCTFLPYWEAEGIIGPQPAPGVVAKLPNPEAVVCSAWVRPTGAVLMIANWGEAETTKEWRVDWKALGLAQPAAATDALTGEAVPLDGEKLTTRVRGRDYLLVRVGG